MLDNITPIINDIKKRQYSAFADILARKESEKYFIDFKRTENNDYNKQRTLYNSDKKNFAKAISGFGNSEGGIIIWGIDASGHIDDYAKAIIPIKGVDNFKSLLESFVSLLTLPVHKTVESFVVKKLDSDDEGVVVTVIPKNNDRPYQNIGDYKYYMRGGDSFIPVPHGILQGMFGHTPQSDVFWMFNINEKPEVGENKAMKWQVGLMVVNGGLGIAKDIYGFARVWVPGSNSQCSMVISDSTNYDFQSAYGVEFSFISKNGYRLGYEQRSQMMCLNFELLPPFTKNFYVELMIGAKNQQVYRKIIEKTPEELTKIYNKCIANPTMESLSDVWDLSDKK